ncbi:hypothetical protein RRG08_029139 [Elysia crispata]|uniref:Uncharacterized protein n=1 Tax=Elysia crispata TaxID=231223 RepID=A0AAE1CTJ0_9GAST|nr:hypothetical protein RRG08_029139 [Elysia crispata]
MNLEYCKLVTVGGMDELRVPASLSQWSTCKRVIVSGIDDPKVPASVSQWVGWMNLEYLQTCHSEWDGGT